MEISMSGSKFMFITINDVVSRMTISDCILSRRQPPMY